MGIPGLDYAWSRPRPSVVAAQGWKWVSRYLSWLPNGKVIGVTEKNDILNAGLDLVLNWEYDARDCLGGSAYGGSHAGEAVRQAKALGYPDGCDLLFSCDFDVSPAQQAVVNSYFAAARDVAHNSGYRVGAYGGYWPISRLFDAGLIDCGWQTYAWSGGNWDNRAAYRQVQNGIFVDGASCDHDEIVGEAHTWRNPWKPAPPAPTPVERSKELFAFKEATSATVYVSDGISYRSVDSPDTFTALVSSGAIAVPQGVTPKVIWDYVLTVPDGTKDKVGGKAA